MFLTNSCTLAFMVYPRLELVALLITRPRSSSKVGYQT